MMTDANPSAAPSQQDMTQTMATSFAGAAFLTRDEAARFLGIAPLTLSRMVASHRIHAYRFARRLRFTQQHLREFLDRHEVRARTQ